MGLWGEIREAYKFLLQQWVAYWRAYGGFRSLIKSPYLHISIVLSLVCWPVWLRGYETWSWFDLAISVIPNLLGFSLGGYAILLAFGNDQFLKLIAGTEEGESVSPYIEVNAAFIHFIFMQIISLVTALAANVWEVKTGVFAFIGFAVFSYAIFTSLAAAIAILELAGWFDKWANANKSRIVKTGNRKRKDGDSE